MSALAKLTSDVFVPDDPSEVVRYPPTLPVEVALKTAPIPDLCKAYRIEKDEWNRLIRDPAFIFDVRRAVETLKKEGASFRMKAMLQAEELLKTSWRLIHAPSDEVPPSVKADLIKFTVRAAGLDADKTPTNTNQNNLQINIQL